MTVQQLQQVLSATTVNEGDFSRQISAGYAGDLLSYVMGNAPSNCAWFTIMTNINVCAVATLVDVAVVVLCEDCQPDELLLLRARQQGTNVISTKLGIFDAIKKVCDENPL